MNAIDFFIFGSDNCDPLDSLRYTFTPTEPESDLNYKEEIKSSTKIFDCYDADNSPIELDLYVWDLAANVSYVIVQLSIIPANDLDCDNK